MQISHSLVAKTLLAFAIILLIGTAYSMNRDYQDSWILEGLEIPFALFVLTFAYAFYMEKNTLQRLTLAVLGRSVFTLIPAVKYVWFLGPWIDETGQQALANYVVTSGHIMTSFPLHPYYVSSPLLHLSFSTFSLVLNIPVVSSMKYLPVFWSMLYPLLIYIIAKNMNMPAKSTLLGYALFISAIPISIKQYIITGSLFGMLFSHLILTILLLIYVKPNRYFWPISVFFAIALAATHSVSSIVFSGLLLILLFLKRFSRLGISFLSSTPVLTLVFIGVAWLVFQANTTLQFIVQIFSSGERSGLTFIPERFGTGSFTLLRINPLSAVRTFLVFFGADAFFLFLTFGGLLLLFRMRKRLNPVSKSLSILYSIILVLIVFGFVQSAGGFRLVQFAELLFPIFSSVFVLHILRKKTRITRLIVGAIFFLIISLATIQFYGFQPLVSPANDIYKELPSCVPISYAGLVNSIYNRQMIIFASKYMSGLLASVFPITYQIVGLTNSSFSQNVVDYDPMDTSRPKPQYDYLLINMPGPAGHYPGNSNPYFNDPSFIGNYISNHTIIYTNGESYVLANTP